jgi:hypothetical protein
MHLNGYFTSGAKRIHVEDVRRLIFFLFIYSFLSFLIGFRAIFSQNNLCPTNLFLCQI